MPKLMIAFASSSAVALGAFALEQQRVPETRPEHVPPVSLPAAAPMAQALPSLLPRASTDDGAISSPAVALSADHRASPPQDMTRQASGHDTLTITVPVQPASTLAPAGAGGVPFTSFTLSAGQADVELRSLTIERTGPGEDGIFEGIVVVDEQGEEVSDERRLDANHRIVFDMSLTIPAGESRTFTLLGSITDDVSRFAGQMPILTLRSIDASASVEGTLPVSGTAQTINDTIRLGGATATLSPEDPGADTVRHIGDRGIRFAGIRLTADAAEDLELGSITWRQDGSAGPDDLEQVMTVVDGVRYPTMRDGREYTSDFSPALHIPKGTTRDLVLVGDITTSGSDRNIQFDIAGSDDISLTGNEYGFGVGVGAGGNTAMEGHPAFITDDGTTEGDEGTPFFAGSIVRISAGSAVYIGR